MRIAVVVVPVELLFCRALQTDFAFADFDNSRIALKGNIAAHRAGGNAERITGAPVDDKIVTVAAVVDVEVCTFAAANRIIALAAVNRIVAARAINNIVAAATLDYEVGINFRGVNSAYVDHVVEVADAEGVAVFRGVITSKSNRLAVRAEAVRHTDTFWISFFLVAFNVGDDLILDVFNGNGAGADFEDNVATALADAADRARCELDNVFAGRVVGDNVFAVAAVVDKYVCAVAAGQGIVALSAVNRIVLCAAGDLVVVFVADNFDVLLDCRGVDCLNLILVICDQFISRNVERNGVVVFKESNFRARHFQNVFGISFLFAVFVNVVDDFVSRAHDTDFGLATERDYYIVAALLELGSTRRELDNVFLVVVENLVVAVAACEDEDIRAFAALEGIGSFAANDRVVVVAADNVILVFGSGNGNAVTGCGGVNRNEIVHEVFKLRVGVDVQFIIRETFCQGSTLAVACNAYLRDRDFGQIEIFAGRIHEMNSLFRGGTFERERPLANAIDEVIAFNSGIGYRTGGNADNVFRLVIADDVVAFAALEDESIFARATKEQVIALAAVDNIIAVAAVNCVFTFSAVDGVVFFGAGNFVGERVTRYRKVMCN